MVRITNKGIGSDKKIHTKIVEFYNAEFKDDCIKNELKNGQLSIIPRSGLPISTTWKLIWHREKSPSPVAKAFMNYIIENKEQIKQNHFE
jgi:hypothetical protein